MDSPDQDKPEVIEARMTAAIKRALATKPTPHKPSKPEPGPKR
jgi:hypothetical protein